MKRILPLAAIEVFVWLILLIVTFLIAKEAVRIDFGMATLSGDIVTQIARLVVSGLLVLVWLLAWKKVADYYLARMLSRSSNV